MVAHILCMCVYIFSVNTFAVVDVGTSMSYCSANHNVKSNNLLKIAHTNNTCRWVPARLVGYTILLL